MAKSFVVTTKELRSFHGIDRTLFRRMVINLRRFPRVCMEIIAMWIWWEAIGYPSIISALREYPDIVLDAFLEEAIKGLYYLDSDTPPTPIEDNMRLTVNLMRRPISLLYLFENRFRGRTVIYKTVNEVFVTAFDDIIQEAAANNGSIKRERPQVLTSVDGRIFIYQNGNTVEFIVPNSVQYPKFPAGYHPSRNFPVMQNLQFGNYSTYVGQTSIQATAAERTLLLMFPRGCAITDKEVRDFLTGIYGDVVESTEMTSVSGRVILRSSAVVADLFQDNERAKAVINGKDVLIRKM
ncbi:hypothetical protein ACHQM5_021773 [Ranunculus cassubicifolius]